MSVEFEFRSSVAFLTLATRRPGNPLDGDTIQALADAVTRAEAECGCRAIVLLSDQPAFCSGMDLQAAGTARLDSAMSAARLLSRTLQRMCQSPKPYIALVKGAATAGGVGLAAACDLVIASPEATFALTEVIFGLAPILIAPFLLRRLPPARFRAMSIATCAWSADYAMSAGLVDEVAADPDKSLEVQLRRLLRSDPAAIGKCKELPRCLGVDPIDVQCGTALAEFEAWTAQPEVAQTLSGFANGLTPLWFERYTR